jgi:class 3 adenylate cyclase
MAKERIERRLTAILAADVAGYSRLIGEDEEGTLAALKALRRELIDPGIAEHKGRIVKTTGDGLLVEWRLDEARAIVARLRAITPLVVPSVLPWRNPEDRELLLSGLRLAMGETN